MQKETENQIKIFYTKTKSDYELLDTGEGQKLEKFGPYTFARPYENAVWNKTLDKKEWEKADGVFIAGKAGAKPAWKMKTKLPKNWVMAHGDIKFFATPTSFRHLSFFPEQASHWDFIYEAIKSRTAPQGKTLGNSKVLPFPAVKFLNLFGYTGVASLSALSAGAEVTHIDASKESLTKLKENQELSGLSEKPLRILLDDCLKFIEKEAKRGNKYDAVIMDPPKFGRGPKGETWKIEEMLPQLLNGVKNILSDKPLFVIVTSYSTDSSSLNLGHALRAIMADCAGTVEQGEMCIIEKSCGRAISMAHTAVWKNK
ncbi:MAG: class I SAM-dependent methyltransferase [Candidatus Nomurabacteria bacterium]|nr:class I SAM-dependent methyltransferase [Candidatus Nomurabacteria bacterium]